jgi:hypothetical protein
MTTTSSGARHRTQAGKRSPTRPARLVDGRQSPEFIEGLLLTLPAARNGLICGCPRPNSMWHQAVPMGWARHHHTFCEHALMSGLVEADVSRLLRRALYA